MPLRRGGHGNAIAQAYGHAILPLCNERDRLTQIVWGLADFRFRFGREAEALWLPETAANDDVLALLIEQGMRYVILAPDQAKGKVDTSKPYLFRHPAAPVVRSRSFSTMDHSHVRLRLRRR